MQQGRSKLMSLIIEIAVMPQSDWCFEMGVWKKQFFTAMLRKGTCQWFLLASLIQYDHSVVTARYCQNVWNSFKWAPGCSVMDILPSSMGYGQCWATCCYCGTVSGPWNNHQLWLCTEQPFVLTSKREHIGGTREHSRFRVFTEQTFYANGWEECIQLVLCHY